MLYVASNVLRDGSFKATQVYKSDVAILRFLQMPLVAIRIGTLLSGQPKWFMLEFVNGVDYPKLRIRTAEQFQNCFFPIFIS